MGNAMVLMRWKVNGYGPQESTVFLVPEDVDIGSYLLLSDGTSFLLLANGTDRLLLASQ